MKKKLQSVFLVIVFTCVPLQAQTQKELSVNYLKSNLEFLADDLLEGREATTRSEKVASLFISKELQKYGIKPFGDNGTYFQNFKMTERIINENASLELMTVEDSLKLNYGEEFVISRRGLPDSSFSGIVTEVIFAGYGVKVDDINYNDYANLDVKGKVVLVLDDLPEDDQSVFDSQKHKNFASWGIKRDIAREMGAVGIIIVPSEFTLENWNRFKNWIKSSSFGLYDTSKSVVDVNQLIPVIAVNDAGLKDLLHDEKISFEEVMNSRGKSNFPKQAALTKKIRINYQVETEIVPARNVIGILGGNRKELSNEYVTIGAHYDHVGTSEDEIFNGADDNGSGTVAILETARQLSAEKNNERPILFIFHTAEEKGLVGAKYLTNNVPWINDVIVHINLDMVGRESPDSIYSVGADRISNELHKLIEKINIEKNYFTFDYSLNDPDHPTRIYWRSDHVHYVNKNIPIAFFFDYMKADYHKPSDSVEKINFNKIYKVSQLAKDILLEISNLDHHLSHDEIVPSTD